MRLAAISILAGLPALPALASQTVSIQLSPDDPGQIIDGFGTCLYGVEADQEWFQSLFFDDLRSSILRIDLTPRFVSPFSDDGYNSPSPEGRIGRPGPDGNNVRTYTGPSDYGRAFAGRSAKIAVMGPEIEQNVRLFDFVHPGWRAAGHLAQRGFAKKTELGDFKLVGSVWSPAPWLKLASGNSITEQSAPRYPKIGTAWPFIWAGCFAGGRFDASGIPRPEFDDSALGGSGPTSALVQFARALAAEVRGFQRTYQVRFYAISLQNELNFETYYDSCAYPDASAYVAVLKAVRREFARYPDLKDILIMGPEDLLGGPYGLWQLGGNANPTHKNLRYLAAVARDPEAAAGLAFFAIHGYAEDGVSSAGGQPDQWLKWLDGWREPPAAGLPANVDGFRSYGKKSWMTETSGETPTWLAPDSGFPGQGALGLAVRIHQALVAGQQSAWIYWQLSDGKPVSSMNLTDAHVGTESAKYVAAKHFFVPIRPGARRIGTHVVGAARILTSAYLHEATGTIVLVVINLESASQPLTVEVPPLPAAVQALRVWISDSHSYWRESFSRVDHGQASLILPAYGLASLVGVGEVPETPALRSLPDITPGKQKAAAGPPRSGCSRLLSEANQERGYLFLIIGIVSAAYFFRRSRP